jgi:hypothetical protein
MLFWFFSLLTALVSWSNLTSSLSPLLTTDGGGWGVTRQTQTGLISKVIPSQDADKKGTDPVYCYCLSRWDLPLPVFWSQSSNDLCWPVY